MGNDAIYTHTRSIEELMRRMTEPPSRHELMIQEMIKDISDRAFSTPIKPSKPIMPSPTPVESADLIATPTAIAPIKLPQQQTEQAQVKVSGTRENEMHLLLKRVYRALRAELGHSPSATQVFRRIELRHEQYDTDGLIQEVRDGVIYWNSLRLSDQKMTLRTVDNVVSRIRTNKI